MNDERTSALAARARSHAALSDVNRLRIIDLLTLSDSSFSHLSATIAMPSNLLAHHLRILEEADLVTRRRSEGDGRRTYIALNRQRAQPSAYVVPDSPAPVVLRVLFVCTANTARSHLAAALWRKNSAVATASAGTHPGERIHRGALATAQRHHLDLPDVTPRLLADTLGTSDLVITVCDRAHEELEGYGWAHWSIPDPVPDSTEAAFERTHTSLSERVQALASRF